MTQTQVLESSIKLPKSFESIHNLVESAYQQKDESEFFKLLCESIMSLLQTYPLLGPLRAKWQEEERAFENELHSTEDLAKRQVRKTYAFFLELLKNEDIGSISGFQDELKRTDDLLENREIHHDGREYEKAYDVLCKLCSILLKHGKSESITGLVTIESREQYVLSGDSYQPKSVPFISGFCFGAAVRKMQIMLASWNQNNSPDWMIWKRLCNATWAWNTSVDIFENKELNFSTPILRKRSNRARGISIDIKKMQALKTEKIQNPNPDRYFSKDRFQLFLKIIIGRIAAELAQKHTEIYDDDEIDIHAMELEKNGNELWIKVEWKEGLPFEQFCLKSNIQTGKITDQFIDMLMKAAPNSTFAVPDRSPADLIERCHLRDAGLKELFFGECTKKHVTFKGIRIERQTIKKEKLAELLNYLQKCHAASRSPIRF
jgi:hypothetical protein